MTTLCVLLAVALQGGACSPGEATIPSPFDGEKALAYVRTFMQFGARVPGTDAHKNAGDWIVSEMRTRADTVYVQEWTHTTTIAVGARPAGTKLPLRNVIARFNPMAEERLHQISTMRGKEQQPVTTVPAGDIAAVAKLADTTTGDVLGTRGAEVEVEPLEAPEPTLAVAIMAKTKGDEDKLANALHRLQDEDPAIRVERNPI